MTTEVIQSFFLSFDLIQTNKKEGFNVVSCLQIYGYETKIICNIYYD